MGRVHFIGGSPHYRGWDGLRCAPAAPKLCVMFFGEF